MKRNHWIIVLAMALLCCSCSFLGNIGDIVGDKPDPTPEPIPEPTPVVQEAVWMVGATLPQDHWIEGPCVLLGTKNYFREWIGGGIKDGGSISYYDTLWTSLSGGPDGYLHYSSLAPWNEAKEYPKAFAICPDGARNWTCHGDTPGDDKDQIYTTKTSVKEPGADGTACGLICAHFPWPGEYAVQIRARCTTNRKVAYIGMVTEVDGQRHISIYQWNQFGYDGPDDRSGVQVGASWVFVGGE